MKVKLKKTGEIINIAKYDTIQLDKCDSYGIPIEVSWDDVEAFLDDNGLRFGMPKFEIPSVLEVKDSIDWEQVRVNASINAMKALVPNTCYIGSISNEEYIAKNAVKLADALIKELKKKSND